MPLQITLTEGFKWAIAQLQAHALGSVPSKDKLDILIQRAESDTTEKRGLYQAALQEEVKLQNPAHPEEGEIPRLNAKLADREKLGARWGTEFKEPTTPALRKAELQRLLDQCAKDCDAIEAQLPGKKAELAQRRTTRELREKLYREALADLKKLKDVAPAILAQTEALDDAKREQLEASAAVKQGGGHAANAIIAELQGGLDNAQAGFDASSIIFGEETDDDIDLDDVVAKEVAEHSSNERVSRWTS